MLFPAIKIFDFFIYLFLYDKIFIYTTRFSASFAICTDMGWIMSMKDIYLLRLINDKIILLFYVVIVLVSIIISTSSVNQNRKIIIKNVIIQPIRK